MHTAALFLGGSVAVLVVGIVRGVSTLFTEILQLDDELDDNEF